MKGVSRYANKEFSKINSIDKNVVLESPYNLLIYITVKGDDLGSKPKEQSWCVCMRKKIGQERVIMTRLNICSPVNLDQFKDTCKYPNDVDPDLAKELGISMGKDLFELALKGDVTLFERAIKEGETNLNKRFTVGNFSLYTALHGAVFNNHLEMIDLIINKNANVNVLDHDNNSPLHYGKISYEAMEKIVNANGNINVVNNKGETPIFVQIRNGQKRLVDYLLEKKARVDLVNEFNENLINILINAYLDGKWERKNFLDMLEVLNHAGVSLDNKSKVPFRDHDYPVVVFAQRDDLEVLKLLLKLKVNFNRRSNNNSTPLMIALSKKNTGLVEFLIEQGADPNLGDGEDLNPLYLAIPDIKMVQYLLDQGFKLNYANIHGLIRRSEDFKNEALTNLIKKYGAEVLAEEGGEKLEEIKQEIPQESVQSPENKEEEKKSEKPVVKPKSKKAKSKKR
ncbi:MAG: hypothetical protein A2381_16850 [Bdellovibrionales bacterium RIFOXYB1_FULL_37_110]|nr:MAG: hypothetical protein A2181_07855 [Bdellovibrionales bacterium RIFOXYA1_FULL_38_20]OFZ50067.1 MAG: hypothetical protein A2417_18685 [Bdellovibrionales bacterium RIFOXYC1_FULL_37_79]OFZ59973.1 MAG: hypothetical protein A2381_16850 [Bdellovibrionales bacterium RIFOXYB1_FULL_37_110]OFZ63944.1 MAG: hypothetical protein A2577_06040 [Bdellovibrionales bacterium RIFOXYD1_FULL_36_51]